VPQLWGFGRDAWNAFRYGPGAPKFAERLWVDPRRVRFYLKTSTMRTSARVVTGDWRTDQQNPIEDDPILKICIARWVERRPWEETGELERMERVIARNGQHGGCRTRADALARCAQLDEIFRVIREERRVRPHGELTPATYREFGGIGMHIGPAGIPIRAVNGRHRFAIARILEIPLIPVRIGMIHASALPLLSRLRSGGLVSADRHDAVAEAAFFPHRGECLAAPRLRGSGKDSR
jgi:hypothetical protein